MRRPPSLARLPSYPVTGGVGLLALLVTLASVAEQPMERLLLGPRTFSTEPWQLLTSALPHGDPLHLLFNLYWLWVFGSLIEEVLGPLFLLLFMAAVAAGSAAAEFAVFRGGIGLSGVGFGLLGLTWALARGDERFRGAVDGRTVRLFLLWGAFCIFTTVFGLLQVANVAHGVGLLLGGLLGLAVARRGAARLGYGLLSLATLAACLLIAGRYREQVNLDPFALRELAYRADEAKRPERAVALYRRSLLLDSGSTTAWFNLGLAEEARGDLAAARQAFQRGCELGSAEACNNLAVMLGQGGAGPGAPAAPDEAGALRLYERACAAGMGLACDNLALKLEDKDPARALELYLRGCEAGHKEGCATLGERLPEALDALAPEKRPDFLARACRRGVKVACAPAAPGPAAPAAPAPGAAPAAPAPAPR